MSKKRQSRRGFLGASGFGMAGIAAALADPPQAAAQVAGVKRGDLPDLTIKEVKVYVTDLGNVRRLNGTETGEIVSIVTNSGHEGNYTIGNRSVTPGWLEWAKPVLPGKNVIDLLPTITATSGLKATYGFGAGARGGGASGRGAGGGRGAAGGMFAFNGGFVNRGGGTWPNYYTATAEIAMWDLLGKAVNRPIYKILGGTKDRIMAYASSQHLAAVEDYVPDILKAKEEGYAGYKIHPGGGQHRDGRPIRTIDMEGLVQLKKSVNTPLHVGEFLFSIADFAEYIKAGALDVARLIADNVGGISGSMRVGMLADAFNMECTPHNWGNPMDLAVHFQLELALPNAYWFEMPHPASYVDRPYHKDKFRIDKDSYVIASAEPGLGYPIDRDALDKMTKRIDR